MMSIMVRQRGNKISRNERKIVVIGEYIVYESCWCCYSAILAENVWKEKGKIYSFVFRRKNIQEVC